MGNKKIYRYPENLVDTNKINVEPIDNKEYRYLLEIPLKMYLSIENCGSVKIFV